jgi:hypothetical protein
MATSEQIPPAAGEDVDAHRQASREAADAGVRFLAEAGEALAASLDWEATLVRVAQLTVPALADWCIVDVLESDGATIHQVAVAAVDPGKEDLLREMRMLYPPTIDSPQPAARALRAGEAVVFREFDPESLASTVRDERHLELITKLAPRAGMAVPLVARGHTLGALTLSWSESGVSTARPRWRSRKASRAERRWPWTTRCSSRESARHARMRKRPSRACATSRSSRRPPSRISTSTAS